MFEILSKNTGLSEGEIANIWKWDANQNLLIFKNIGGQNEFLKSTILDIFKKIQMNGPLCGEPLTEIKFTIYELNMNVINAENAFTELSALLYEGVKKAINEAGSILLEPIYHTVIQLPPDFIKISLSLLSKFAAKIKNINQDNEYQASIEVFLPVRNSIKFAEEIRSATSGKAFWQNEFYAFMEVRSTD